MSSISKTIFVLLFLFSINLAAKDFKTVTFTSTDGLLITADLYQKHDLSKPFIILFHQAGWSRGEYKEIAPKLVEMGFNCLAVDQRSGGQINNVINETNKLAIKQNKGTRYIDAYQDMQAALEFVKDKYAKGKIIVWGSSYSSALSLVLASENQNIVSAVLAFAPGEYFAAQGKTKTFITEAASKINIPAFITSAKHEKPNWENIYSVIPSKSKMFFLPKTDGNHGSRALWEKFDDNKEYWKAVTEFLNKIK